LLPVKARDLEAIIWPRPQNQVRFTVLHEKLALTPIEVAKLLGIHLNSVRKFVKNGTLPSFRLGKKVLIPRAALERLLNTDEKTPAGGGGKR